MKKAVVFMAIAGILLSGCAEKDKRVIVVGTSNDYPPYCYLDANGSLAGFEKAVLDALIKKLPQYRVKYEVLEFKNIIASLDTGRVDIAAHQFNISGDREEKYLFSAAGYGGNYTYIVVPEATNDVQTLDDLAGKNVSVPPASNWAYTLEAYNAQHAANQINIQYYEATPDILITNMSTGVTDATLLSEADVKLINTFWNSSFKTAGEPLGELDESRYIFRKDATDLQRDIDGALRELKQSGELEQITKKAVDDFFANTARR
jgi:L-cystine transport system substrate-binding protein